MAHTRGLDLDDHFTDLRAGKVYRFYRQRDSGFPGDGGSGFHGSLFRRVVGVRGIVGHGNCARLTSCTVKPSSPTDRPARGQCPRNRGVARRSIAIVVVVVIAMAIVVVVAVVPVPVCAHSTTKRDLISDMLQPRTPHRARAPTPPSYRRKPASRRLAAARDTRLGLLAVDPGFRRDDADGGCLCVRSELRFVTLHEPEYSRGVLMQ